MRRIWFPEWLYRRLPLIYLVGAAGMFFGFGETAAGLSSSLLLGAAALLIWGLRWHARSAASRRRH